MDYTIDIISKDHVKTITEWFYNPIAFFLANPGQTSSCGLETQTEILLSKQQTFGLFFNDEIVGVISLNGNRISHLFILQAHRNKKLAKELVKKVLNCHSEKCLVYLHKNQREHHQLFSRMNFTKTDETIQFSFENNNETFLIFEHE
jgi:GNAT superfamily N-acetyltransferase